MRPLLLASAFLAFTAPLQAQWLPFEPKLPKALIDAEDAWLAEDFYLDDNGRTFIFTREGPKESNYARLADFGRRGGRSVLYHTSAGASMQVKQRTEHRIGGSLSNHYRYERLYDGFEKYVGFSIYLDPDAWTPPDDWFNIHQFKQVGYVTYSNVLLNFKEDGSNTLRLTHKHGVSGASGLHSTVNKDLFPLETGVWYDVVVGWRFWLVQPVDGFCHVWIKKAGESRFQKFGWDDTRVGYKQGEREVLSLNIGMYKAKSQLTNRMYFDEVFETRGANAAAVAQWLRSME